MADAFETILVAWLAFAFLPERPTRSQGGTDGSNPLSSTGESIPKFAPPSSSGMTDQFSLVRSDGQLTIDFGASLQRDGAVDRADHRGELDQ